MLQKDSLSHPSSPRRLWLGAALILVGLLAALSWLFLVVYRDWQDEQRDSLIQELLWLDQSLRLHMEEHQRWLDSMSDGLPPASAVQGQRFLASARLLERENREIVVAQWVERGGLVKLDSLGRPPHQLDAVGTDAMWRAEKLGRTAYGQPYLGPDNHYRFDLVAPVLIDGRFVGGVRLVYSMSGLLQQQVPWWIASKYHISLVDLGGHLLASKFEQAPPLGTQSHQISFDPPGFGVMLRGISYRTGIGLTLPVLSALIVVLVIALLFLLWRIRRHVRQRASVEQALQREMSIRRAVEDSMKSGLIAFDRDGAILRVNRAMCELTGLTVEELVGQRLPYSFWAEEDHTLLMAAMRAMLAGELPAHGFELPFRRRDGERVEVRLYAAPLLQGERQEGWVASMYDITELKKKRLALNASHQRFLTVLNGLDSGLCVVDGDSRLLLYANPAFAGGWGGFDAEGPYCPLLPGMARGLDQMAANLEFSPDRGRSWYQLQYRAIDWVDGEPAWLCMLVDVSESRARASRERAQEERFQTTSRLIAMGEMASSLAHELGQPLTAISTYAAGLARKLPSDAAQNNGVGEAVQAIADQARRAGQIVNSIRAFVKKHAPQLELCDPDLALRRAVALAQPMADKYGMPLLLEPGPAGQRVEMDPVLIEQVLLNLIKNAIEAMREADSLRPTVRLKSAVGAQFWRVEVVDNGPGLSEEIRGNLFTPFYSTKPQGMGIGLNICRSIVEHHRGEFGVSAPLTGGCAFWFTLPLYQGE